MEDTATTMEVEVEEETMAADEDSVEAIKENTTTRITTEMGAGAAAEPVEAAGEIAEVITTTITTAVVTTTTARTTTMEEETIHTSNNGKKTIIITMVIIMGRIMATTMAKEIITINRIVVTMAITTMITRTSTTKGTDGTDHRCGDNDEVGCPTK